MYPVFFAECLEDQGMGSCLQEVAEVLIRRYKKALTEEKVEGAWMNMAYSSEEYFEMLNKIHNISDTLGLDTGEDLEDIINPED